MNQLLNAAVGQPKIALDLLAITDRKQVLVQEFQDDVTIAVLIPAVGINSLPRFPIATSSEATQQCEPVNLQSFSTAAFNGTTAGNFLRHFVHGVRILLGNGEDSTDRGRAKLCGSLTIVALQARLN
jgi:hypothetical protein